MPAIERRTTIQTFEQGWPSWIRGVSGSLEELPAVHRTHKLPDKAHKLTGLITLFSGPDNMKSGHTFLNGGWSVDGLIEYWNHGDDKDQQLFADSDVQLYVSKNGGNFPGGHGLPLSSDNHLITRVKLSDAVNKMRSNRTTDEYYLCSDEFYYIYQAHISKFPKPFEMSGIDRLVPYGFVQGIWISSAGCFTPIHYDNSDNVLMQLHGRKQVIIWRPDDVENLYLNAEDQPMDRKTQIDFTVMDDEGMRIQFPKFSQSRPYSTILNPGDALYIPKGWPHAVYSETYSVSLNYW